MIKKIILLIVLLTSIFSFSQEKFTLSGTIADLKTKETLIGVNVFILETKTGITTNEYGFYSITLPKGEYTISISYVGYQVIDEKISLNSNIKKNFLISDNSLLEISNFFIINSSAYSYTSVGFCSSTFAFFFVLVNIHAGCLL